MRCPRTQRYLSAKPRGKPPFTSHVSNIPDVIGRARGDPKGIPELESDRGVIPEDEKM